MTPFDPSRVIEHLHGHLGWLAAISLVHPAVLLRHPRRRAHLSVLLATAAVTVAGGMGASAYPAYREVLRRAIFVEAPALGLLFERKEHLAFGAISFAWVGTLAYFSGLSTDGQTRTFLRRAAHWAFVAAATLAVLAAVFGTVVAAYKTF